MSTAPGGPGGRLGVTVLARAPEPGRVKTRLAASLGEAAACRVHEALAGDVLETLGAWSARAPARHRPSLALAWTGSREAAAGLAREAAAAGFLVEEQPEGGLDVRMLAGVERRLASGSAAALVVGTDCPFLDVTLLDAAAAALAAHDAVLAPARDGGFVLLGARRSWGGALAGLPWGTERALAETRATLAEAGLAVATLPGLSEDVDDLASLARVAARVLAEGTPAPRLRAWLLANRAAWDAWSPG